LQLTSIFLRNCSFTTPKPKSGENMKTPKVFCAATVLALFLSIPAYAEDPKPGDMHEPGRASCVYETPCDQAGDGSTGSTITVDNDFSLSAVVDMLWTVASIF
jgi:hypothetical protein